jgi:hypothetical protein
MDPTEPSKFRRGAERGAKFLNVVAFVILVVFIGIAVTR